MQVVRSEARRAARRVPSGALSLEDLVGFGTVGLLEARARWMPDSGVPFEAHARLRIRGAIVDAIRHSALLSRRGWERMRDYALAHAVTSEAGGQSHAAPPVEAAELGRTITALAVAFLVEAGQAVEPEHGAPAEDRYIDEETRVRLGRAMGTLSVEDREIVEAVYDFSSRGDSGADLAKRRGVSRSTISRAHLRILDDLRTRLEG